MKSSIQNWKHRARQLRSETYALYLVYRDARTPWYAKLWSVCVVAYAFSPIDLIPDFIPILGYLDDVILVPLGVALALRLIPEEVMEESRERARAEMELDKPVNWAAAVFIVLIWALAIALTVTVAARIFRGD
jgi:uncharacterized membrane protein YkvA (DUF1232 family)